MILKCVCKECMCVQKVFAEDLRRECILVPECLFGGALQWESSSREGRLITEVLTQSVADNWTGHLTPMSHLLGQFGWWFQGGKKSWMDSLSTLHHQHCIVNRLHQATESESTGLMVGSWVDSASMGRSLRGHLFLHAEAAVARVQRMQALSQKLH